MSCRYVFFVHHADVFAVSCLHRSRSKLSPSLTRDARHASMGETLYNVAFDVECYIVIYVLKLKCRNIYIRYLGIHHGYKDY